MATSYNGWPASASPAAIGIVPLVVGGHSFAPGCKSGPVHTVLAYVAHRLMTEVEPAGEGCWGYAYRRNRNAANLSCHASGTAIDFNAPKHPNGRSGTFTAKQVAAIERILRDVGVVAWGGHFNGTKDEMHFEIHGTPAEVGAVAQRLTTAKPAPKPTPEDDVTDAEIEKIAQRVKQLVAQDLAVLLHGTKDGSHPYSIDSIAMKVGVPTT